MKIQAWKCPYTGKIFEEKDRAKYIACRRKGRKDFLRQQEADNLRNTWKAWLLAEKMNITDPFQIPEWFLENQKKIMEATNAIHGVNRWASDFFVPEDEFVALVFTGIKYSELVSNSHSCPVGGVQNFIGDNTMPKGYPGWSGYIKGSLIRPAKYDSGYPYSAALNLVGIHTGSGGGGNKGFGYDIKIFLGDWPGLGSLSAKIENDKRLSAIRADRKSRVAKVKRERDLIVRRLQTAGDRSYR